MLQLFIFMSTRCTDQCSGVHVVSSNKVRAKKLINRKFTEWGYKGKPKLAV